MVGDVLDLIDNALRDYAVSGEAMRWTPDAAVAGEVRERWPVVVWAADLVRSVIHAFRVVRSPAPDGVYQEALAAGLSDYEARDEAWPAAAREVTK